MNGTIWGWPQEPALLLNCGTCVLSWLKRLQFSVRYSSIVSQKYETLRPSIINIYLFYVVSAFFYFKSSGKTVAVINGFTFYCHRQMIGTDRWQCSNTKICRAFFIATKKREVIRSNLEHNHSPSKFVIHKGLYMKV